MGRKLKNCVRAALPFVLFLVASFMLFRYQYYEKNPLPYLKVDKVEDVIRAVENEKPSNISLDYVSREYIGFFSQTRRLEYQILRIGKDKEQKFTLPLDDFIRYVKPVMERNGYMFRTPRRVPP
jgi:hypothetical protein